MQEKTNNDSRDIAMLMFAEVFRLTEFPTELSPEKKVEFFIEKNQPLDEKKIEKLRLRQHWLKIAKSASPAHP